MSKPDSRLLFFALALCLLAVVWGCSQADDIAASISVTDMWLTPELLPSAPSGMVYELWATREPVTDTAIPASKLVSLGRFSYVNNDTLKAFLDENGAVRADSNKFALDDDLFKYANLVVSVEPEVDADVSRLGPIMLVASVAGNTDTMTMNFPLYTSLWGGHCRYAMEGLTDGDRQAHDGYGVWFSWYKYNVVYINDTFGIDSSSLEFEWETIEPIINDDGETTNLSELYSPNPDSVYWEVETVAYDFGRDTFPLELDSIYPHIRTALYIDSVADSTPPFRRKVFDWTYIVESTQVSLDIFEQDSFALPDYSDWGWVYQGWVTSNYIPKEAFGQMTPPGWAYKDLYNNIIPGDTGGLISTGTFININQPDDGNPYTLQLNIIDSIIYDDFGSPIDTVYMRPDIAGEDFLDGAALSAASGGVITEALNLLPYGGGSNYGSVFISMEPANRLTDSTNFPLLAFIRSFPDSWSANDTESFDYRDMKNWTYGPGGGFPEVMVIIHRF